MIKKISFKKVIAGFGVLFLALLLVFMINDAFIFLYRPFDYTDFCPDAGEVDRLYDDKKTCEIAGGEWVHWTRSQRSNQYEGDLCSFHSATCSKDFNRAKQGRASIIAVLSVVMGLFFVVLKTAILGRDKLVSNLFFLSGIILIVLGLARYWFDIDPLIGDANFWISMLLYSIFNFGNRGWSSGIHF